MISMKWSMAIGQRRGLRLLLTAAKDLTDD